MIDFVFLLFDLVIAFHLSLAFEYWRTNLVSNKSSEEKDRISLRSFLPRIELTIERDRSYPGLTSKTLYQPNCHHPYAPSQSPLFSSESQSNLISLLSMNETLLETGFIFRGKKVFHYDAVKDQGDKPTHHHSS